MPLWRARGFLVPTQRWPPFLIHALVKPCPPCAGCGILSNHCGLSSGQSTRGTRSKPKTCPQASQPVMYDGTVVGLRVGYCAESTLGTVQSDVERTLAVPAGGKALQHSPMCGRPCSPWNRVCRARNIRSLVSREPQGKATPSGRRSQVKKAPGPRMKGAMGSVRQLEHSESDLERAHGACPAIPAWESCRRVVPARKRKGKGGNGPLHCQRRWWCRHRDQTHGHRRT